jgi:putative hydrolase of the HAD superfamily
MTRHIQELAKNHNVMRKPTIISFDLDDTLFDNGPVILHAFQALFDHLCEYYPGFSDHFTPQTFIEFAHETRQAHPDIVDFNVLRHIHINRALVRAGFDEQNTETAYAVFLDARQQVRLFPESVPVLEQLNKKYTLISISNGNANPEHIGLGNYFSASFNPTSIGYAKPDPAMYSKVCEQLGIEPWQILHIGDCLDNDYQAALNAGCRAIWFNAKGRDLDNHPQVRHLSELPAVIESLEA